MVALDVIVVGGGISGIATAFAIQRAGHTVTVLESNPIPNKSRGALASPPNMTRVLNQWGLQSLLETKGSPCGRVVCRHGDDGSMISLARLHEQFLAELCAGYHFVQHGDLLDALMGLGMAQGMKVRQSAPVKCILRESGTVVLQDGEELKADLIVGADGSGSIVRDSFNQVDEPQGDMVNVMVGISVGDIEEDELKEFLQVPTWHMWLGEGYEAWVKVVDSEQTLAIAMSKPVGSMVKENWEHEELDLEDVMDKFEPRLQKLLKKNKTGSKTIRPLRSVVEHIVDDKGRCVLVGDAAHPLPIGGTQTTALCIEDAEVLGTLLSFIHGKEELQYLLSAYEELRLPRLHEVQNWDGLKHRMKMLPYGEEQKLRDQKYQESMPVGEYDEMDEATFRATWGGELDEYRYNATEAAQDWWTKWGAFLSSKAAKQIQISIQISS